MNSYIKCLPIELKNAAPDLLAALEDLVRDCKEPLDADTTKYFVEQAEKAIAKARGES